MTPPGDSRHSVLRVPQAARVYDDERTGTAIGVIQRHFLRGRNQVNVLRKKIDRIPWARSLVAKLSAQRCRMCITTTRIPRTKRTASNNLSPSSCLNVLRLMFRVLLRLLGYSRGKWGSCLKRTPPRILSQPAHLFGGVRLSRRSTVAAIEHGGRHGRARSNSGLWTFGQRLFRNVRNPRRRCSVANSVSRDWIVESL